MREAEGTGKATRLLNAITTSAGNNNLLHRSERLVKLVLSRALVRSKVKRFGGTPTILHHRQGEKIFICTTLHRRMVFLGCKFS